MISILPPLSLRRITDFLTSPEISSKEKHLALLQSLSFWGSCELENLLVIKSMSSFDAGSVLYVHPTPQLMMKNNNKRQSSSSSTALMTDFENDMKQLLLASGSVLSSKDRSMLIEKLSGGPEAIGRQLRLFFQLKLFVPSRESAEFLKIMKDGGGKTGGGMDQGLGNWLDKERALAMKEAVERSLNRMDAGGSVTPYKKAYLEFLVQTGQGTSGEDLQAMAEMFSEIVE
jgi:hypothetical protein